MEHGGRTDRLHAGSAIGHWPFPSCTGALCRSRITLLHILRELDSPRPPPPVPAEAHPQCPVQARPPEGPGHPPWS